MEEKLDMMFFNVTTTGKHSWVPSFGVLPVESDDDVDPLEVNGGSNESMPIETTHTTNNQIERLVEVVESRSTGTSMANTVSQGTSIAEVMKDVAILPGASVIASCGGLQLNCFVLKRIKICLLSWKILTSSFNFLIMRLVEG
ncbi:unnamed protein product [Prunus brigantina]